MCEICELRQRIQVLEARLAVLEQRPNYVPYTPSPLYPWHEKTNTGDWTPQQPVTWCCARNTHEEDK